MTRTIFHVDLDAFYASVEQQDNPSLKGKPVIVGPQPGNRGVVSACSYEARRFGIHSGMPVSRAARLCPQGIFRPVRMKRYLEISEEIMKELADITPVFQQISIDEAFLDLSGTERLFGPALQVGRMIKERIADRFGLTLSIGIAANKFLAKLASEYEKPDGLFQVTEPIEFLDRLSLKDIWGIGEKTLDRLAELNITSIQKLRSFSRDILCSMMGVAGGRYLYLAARGMDPGIYSDHPRSHSISSERTFARDKKDRTAINKTLLELSQQIMHRLIVGGWQANTAVLKVRYEDFTTTTIQKTLKHYLTSSDELYRVALELLRKKWNGSTPIRLLGVGTTQLLRPGSLEQGELFEDRDLKRRKVEQAVTELKEKMKGLKLTKASLLETKDRCG